MTSIFQNAPFDSIHDMREFVNFCTDRYPDQTAFRYYKNKEVVEVTFTKFRNDVSALSAWLHHEGCQGERIALYGENSYAWIVAHFAITCSGNIAVPLDRNLTPEQIEPLLIKSRSALLIHSKSAATKLEGIKAKGIRCLSMEELPVLIEMDQDEHIPFPFTDEVTLHTDDTAAIVFTSGTTGTSKGVVLTHRNLIMNARASSDAAVIHGGNILVLPLHHMLAFTTGVTAVMLYGYSVYINDSIRHLSRDLVLAKPQHTVLVPMIVEGLYKTILRAAEKKNQTKKLKFGLSLSNAARHLHIDLRKKLFKEVLSALGGNLETIICGGAPLDEKYIRSFGDLGITILNGYGITECAPVVSVNRGGNLRAGTVGQALFCNEMKIVDPDDKGIGEILVKGSNVMKGYFDEPSLTKEVFSGDWFRTGDLGKIDDDGFLYITGRIKNLIILKNGENISPEELEESLLRFDEIAEVVVFGDGEQIAAEIYPNPEIPDAKEIIRKKIADMNKGLPVYKQITNLKFRDTEFEKTTTKKIKRAQVHA